MWVLSGGIRLLDVILEMTSDLRAGSLGMGEHACPSNPASRHKRSWGTGYRGGEASIGIDMTIVLECHTVDYMPVTFPERRYPRKYSDTVPNKGFYEEGGAGSVNRDVHTGGHNEFFLIKVRTIYTYGLHTSCPVRDISPGSV